MTPDALRTLATLASNTADEITTQNEGDPNLLVVMASAANASAFRAFARVLAEAANTERSPTTRVDIPPHQRTGKGV